jgi:hypothetical protein
VSGVRLSAASFFMELRLAYCTCLIASSFWQALRHESHLALTPAEVLSTKNDILAWIILSTTGFISLLIAVFASGQWIVAAGWVYALLSIAMPLHGTYGRRAVEKRFNAAGPEAT